MKTEYGGGFTDRFPPRKPVRLTEKPPQCRSFVNTLNFQFSSVQLSNTLVELLYSDRK